MIRWLAWPLMWLVLGLLYLFGWRVVLALAVAAVLAELLWHTFLWWIDAQPEIDRATWQRIVDAKPRRNDAGK